MNLTQGAAILCNRKQFRAFLALVSEREITTADVAASAVRDYCGVSSRHELNTCTIAGGHYRDLVEQFNQWLNRDL